MVLTELQKQAAAPLFPIPVQGWLDRPGYERIIAEATGGRLARGAEQRFFDVDHGEVGLVEWSKSLKGFCWVDALRVLEAVRSGYIGRLNYGFIRYSPVQVEAITFAPLADVYRMLALGGLEDDLLAHAASARENTSQRHGWPRGHVSLHHTIEDRDLAQLVAQTAAGFSGEAQLQATKSYYERALQESSVPCAILDDATGDWRMPNAPI